MIETVLIADTEAIGRTLANELGLPRRTTLVVSKADHLRGQRLDLNVRVVDRAEHMSQQTQRAIEDNLVLCGVIPGTATLSKHDDGTRTVMHADPVIAVDPEVLTLDLDADFIEEDGTLRLDTAGEYRYRFVRVQDENTHVYERITG